MIEALHIIFKSFKIQEHKSVVSNSP